jgi:hypothetical protein
LLFSFVAVALGVAHEAAAQEFNLGRIWQVRECEPDGSYWDGTWTRRGHSPVFDAQWRHSGTGALASDVIEFRGARDDGYYYGHLSHDGTRKAYRLEDQARRFGHSGAQEYWRRYREGLKR